LGQRKHEWLAFTPEVRSLPKDGSCSPLPLGTFEGQRVSKVYILPRLILCAKLGLLFENGMPIHQNTIALGVGVDDGICIPKFSKSSLA
jgi:hypothetical protein